MQSLTAAILCLAVAAPPAGKPAHSAPAAASPVPPPPRAGESAASESPYSAETTAYAALDPAARVAYVERLIAERLEPAARTTLDERALARQRAIDLEILTRHRAGEPISPRGLIKVLRKVDQLEAGVIAALVRRYRVEVYSQFHSQTADYDQRIGAWQQVEDGWWKNGARPDQQPLLIAWLATACQRIAADRTAELPAAPEFGARATARIAPPPGTRQPPDPIAASPPRVAIAAKPADAPPAAPADKPLAKAGSAPQSAPAAPHPARPTTAPIVAARPTIPDKEPPPVSTTDQPLKRQTTRARGATRTVEIPPAEGEATPSVQIDLDELAVRIAGYNLALDRLAGTLHETDPWPVERLAEALVELEDLAARRHDLALYWHLIEPADRDAVGELHDPSAVISLLGSKLNASRVAELGHAGDAPKMAGPGQGTAFDRLSQRLAQLTFDE